MGMVKKDCWTKGEMLAVTWPLMSPTLASASLVHLAALGVICLQRSLPLMGSSYSILGPANQICYIWCLSLCCCCLWVHWHSPHEKHMAWIFSGWSTCCAVTWFNGHCSFLGRALKAASSPVLSECRPRRAALWESWLVDWVQRCYSPQTNAAVTVFKKCQCSTVCCSLMFLHRIRPITHLTFILFPCPFKF